MSKGPWKKLHSKTDYKNPYWTVIKDRVIKPDGSKGFYYTVKVVDFVVVIALEKDKKHIHLIRQFRYAIKKNSWEAVEGLIDKGEGPLQAAKRELAEESGFRAKKFTKIGFNYLGNGLTDQAFHIYVATDLIAGKQSLDSGEADMITKKFSIKKVNEMVLTGEITDSPTVVAMYFLNNYLKKI